MGDIIIKAGANADLSKFVPKKVDSRVIARGLKAHYSIVEEQPLAGMTQEEINTLHANIRFTHEQKQKESYEKMETDEFLSHALPPNRFKV